MRRAFVVTVGTLAVCACTPPRTRKTSPPAATAGKAVANVDYSKLTPLNPRDEQKREIYAAGDTCYVRVAFDKPPKSWQPPKRKQVDCPPSMDDPAWDQCTGGRILRANDSSTCVCTSDGNPPPPPREVDCPR